MIAGHGGNIYELARRLGCSPFEIDDVSSNVNPLGPPPGLCEFLAGCIPAITVLPEVDNQELIRRFAGYAGLPAERVLAAGGTTQFIYSLARVLPEKRALILGPTYADYADGCRVNGLQPEFVLAEEKERFEPPLARLEAALRGQELVFICNPNNPTGRLIPGRELAGLCRRHPRTRFIVDESYLPFVRGAEEQSLSKQGLANVIVLLSISKIFRIPGLRIGFLVAAPETVAACSPSVWPWSVNSLAHGAMQYIAEHPEPVRAFVLKTRGRLEREREAFRGLMEKHPGFTVFPACASFMLVRLPEALSSGRAWAQLAEERILVRDCSNFHGLSDRFIRICPKSPELSSRIAERLGALAAQGKGGGAACPPPSIKPADLFKATK
jgi:threonine-phosphate decarboxylase